MTKRPKRKGETTKSKVVSIAMDLFQRRGFAAVGLNELCAEGNVPKGSIYYHFPNGKNDIAIAVVAKAQAEIGDAIQLAGKAAGSVDEFISLIVDGFAQNLTRSDFEKGCPVSTLALELSAQEADIASAISDCYDHWQQIVAVRLADFGLEEKSAKDLAQFSFCALEGALILARTQRSLTPLQRTHHHLSIYLK